ncbi:hypothetical protein [Actinoplanes aureus]|uniref:Uncharacterized protein n=1 Tax=Actinoplanes aureus TaxID=2792083 RepID=A0A931CFA1_9ACTN|nr:hypothetical protein [Actinoplanes aureus]MBG0567529.1 hypothetical protein [Actinoplanes aureus]
MTQPAPITSEYDWAQFLANLRMILDDIKGLYQRITDDEPDLDPDTASESDEMRRLALMVEAERAALDEIEEARIYDSEDLLDGAPDYDDYDDPQMES